MKTPPTHSNIFEKISYYATWFTGTTAAFMIALLVVVGWVVSGPFLGYSESWQLAINTTTTILTFLMVFLIQRGQNKDSHAIHLKLNELVASLNGPSNRLIDVEELSEGELEVLATYYRKLSEMARKEKDLSASHSIEEAEELHKLKYSN